MTAGAVVGAAWIVLALTVALVGVYLTGLAVGWTAGRVMDWLDRRELERLRAVLRGYSYDAEDRDAG